jgi:vacuolar-type H+-ATPase subunit C/Vma6
MVTWGDVNVRARGLGTHLLGRARLEPLARAPDLPALATDLAAAGYPMAAPEGVATAFALELGVRRGAAARLRTLTRWTGSRTRTLAVVFEDEDRRSLRSIIRGALQVTARDERLAGLIPTPTLPERALEELAGLETASRIAALLVAWRNPYGPPLSPVAREQRPDPFELELALSRTFARRALHASRRGGGELKAYVRRVIDVENLYGALLLAGAGEDVDAARCFLEGGFVLDRTAFLAAAAEPGRAEAVDRLRGAFVGTPIAEVLARSGADPARLEAALLAAQIAVLRRRARVAPLGPAPVLGYVLRLRAEVIDLQRIIWGASLGAPGPVVIGELVTAR